MKQTESSKIWLESFITAACFNHYKYVLTPRSFFFFFSQYGHWETDLKTPWWAGKWLIPTTQQNSRGAQEPNWQPDIKLIHSKTEHMRLTDLPDVYCSFSLLFSLSFSHFLHVFVHPSRTPFSNSWSSKRTKEHFSYAFPWKCVWFLEAFDADDFCLKAPCPSPPHRRFGSDVTPDKWLWGPPSPPAVKGRGYVLIQEERLYFMSND